MALVIQRIALLSLVCRHGRFIVLLLLPLATGSVAGRTECDWNAPKRHTPDGSPTTGKSKSGAAERPREAFIGEQRASFRAGDRR
jgi:hypothetical protein